MNKRKVALFFTAVFFSLALVSADLEKNPFDQIWAAILELTNQVNDLFSITSNLQEQLNNITLTPGPQGPQGEPGPDGPPGQQGEPGPTRPLETTYVLSSGGGQIVSCCPAGWVRTGCSISEYISPYQTKGVIPTSNECCQSDNDGYPKDVYAICLKYAD